VRAIILATGDTPAIAPLGEHFPTPLLPLMDRPFLQHVLEYCIHQSITRFDFILHHLPERIEHYFGDGKRWGCSFTYHLVRESARPYRLLRVLHFENPDELLLLGDATMLPPFQLTAAPAVLPLLYGWRDAEGVRRWTGWALLSPRQLASLPANPDARELEAHWRDSEGGERLWHEVPGPLSVASFDKILEAHRAVLNKTFSGLLLGTREAEPGIWLARNVRLHPTVQLFAPVYIGENSSIEKGARLGPQVTVGKDCLVDVFCHASNCAVFPGSYVGQHLDLEDSLVNKNLLINVRLGGAVSVGDALLIGSFSGSHFGRGLSTVVARLTAMVLLVLALPLLLLVALALRLVRRGPVLLAREVVRLPAPPEARRWRRFPLRAFRPGSATEMTQGMRCDRGSLFMEFLPGLIHVVKGELAFVGLPPRDVDQIKALPPDWKALYLQGKAGLVTEASLNCAPDADEDEVYAAEAFYTARSGWKYDLKLLLRFLVRALFSFKSTKTDAALAARSEPEA
jgi:hypothetical protein